MNVINLHSPTKHDLLRDLQKEIDEIDSFIVVAKYKDGRLGAGISAIQLNLCFIMVEFLRQKLVSAAGWEFE